MMVIKDFLAKNNFFFVFHVSLPPEMYSLRHSLKMAELGKWFCIYHLHFDKMSKGVQTVEIDLKP